MQQIHSLDDSFARLYPSLKLPDSASVKNTYKQKTRKAPCHVHTYEIEVLKHLYF